ncbi:MAG: hypothetical protein E6I85_04080 [Chloroflexi bacterium]|nr:MAG: hypothetical protein E6I85_04080 [Chloroflexota bacterium]
MPRQDISSKPGPLLPESLMTLIEGRRTGLARHMARAVVTEISWDASTGAPPSAAAIARACEAGLDLFLATAREARAPTAEELRRVAQLGVHQARGSQSVGPVLAAYRVAAKVAWSAILTAWRETREADPEAMVVTANYVFTALDQVAAEVTKTYLAAREQHLQRGTRARTRFFHALISDTFDSELALQKQALALNVQLASGYRAIVLRLIQGKAEAERGAEMLQEAMSAVEPPARTLAYVDNPSTLVVLWPEGGPPPRRLIAQLQAETELRWAGRLKPVVRAGLGSFHPGLHGVSRSYLEAQQAMEIGRRLRPEGGAHDYEEVVPYLVMTQNPLLADRYVRHHLGPLLDADSKGGQHLPTLEAFLAKGSVKDAAEALHLHRHTVIYRLDRLKEILGFDLDDPFVRHRMQMALDLRKLL